ncbi:hypothetical protein ACHWQZ_G006658 [Mnemiopsis leidyi]
MGQSEKIAKEVLDSVNNTIDEWGIAKTRGSSTKSLGLNELKSKSISKEDLAAKFMTFYHLLTKLYNSHEDLVEENSRLKEKVKAKDTGDGIKTAVKDLLPGVVTQVVKEIVKADSKGKMSWAEVFKTNLKEELVGGMNKTFEETIGTQLAKNQNEIMRKTAQKQDQDYYSIMSVTLVSGSIQISAELNGSLTTKPGNCEINVGKEVATKTDQLLFQNQQEKRKLRRDFNFPGTRWQAGISDAAGNSWLNLFVERNFSFLLPDGTVTRERVVAESYQRSSLDQVMCSEDNVLTTFVIEKPLGKSDHMCIIFKALLSTDYDFITQRKINWSKYSEDSMKLVNNEISWDTMLHDSSSDVRSLWSEILEKLQLFETAAPTYEVKLDNSGKVVEKDPWESMSLVRARAKCNRFWKNFEQNPSKMSHNWAMNAQDEYDQRIRDNRMLYEKKITKSMKENPKRFFSYLNSRRKIKSGVSRLKKPDGTITTSAQETADQLADFFEETYITDNCEDSSNDLLLYATTDHIEDLKFNHDEVKTLLSRLSIAKSIGPDGAHPKLLRFLSHDNGFIRTITHLFQSIYDSGEMPTIWKTANVTALHKKGDKGLASNYRPISLTSVLSKVFEKLLRNHILRHFAPHCYDQQHGFQPKKSCLSNLLDCMDTVYDLLDDEGYREVVQNFYMQAVPTQKSLDS